MVLEAVATKWLVRFDAADDPDRIWRSFRQWIDESPAHLDAFRIAQGFWNIGYAAARALSPTAGEKNRELRLRRPGMDNSNHCPSSGARLPPI